MAEPRSTIRVLRRTMVAAAVVLLLVLVGFIGYGRYRALRFWKGLPGKLGVNITQETNGFTYSQSVKGRTVFTVHAAKEIQRKDGKVTLHDVGIVLYGAKGERADRIHGNEFEYDQKAGVMTAVGEVYIDVAAPANGRTEAVGDDSRVIHVKTSGLVFRQSERTAATDEAIEFSAGGMTGHAVGASYDSEKSVVVLRSAVRVSGIRQDRPMVLTAARAELDQTGNVALLEGAKLLAAGEGGTQMAAGDHAVVRLASDGTPQRIEAQGNVRLSGDGRGTVLAERMEMELTPAAEPKAAHLFGGVRFASDGVGRSAEGQATDARVAFDGEGRPVHALLTGAVQMDEEAGRSRRGLRAERLDLTLAGGGKERLQVRGAEASGGNGATLKLVDAAVGKDAKGKRLDGTATTSLQADVFEARFDGSGKQSQLVGLDGAGRTVVERALVDGAGVTQWRETGTGASLKIALRPGAKGRSEIVRAEQRGAVKVVREALAKAASKQAGTLEREQAEGDDAVYEADADRVTMTGQVRVADAESAVFADRVTMDRRGGDATAEGAVRVSYVAQGSEGEPVHVLAAKAVAHKATGVTEFTAAAGTKVRMWQADSSVEAPVIDFDRTKKMVTARGVSGADASAVNAVLAGATDAKSRKASGPVRVVSREMVYADATRQVEFRGGVRVEDQAGTMRSREAVVSLTAGSKDASANDAAGLLSGKVERMVGQGEVEIDQPGRKALGEKIVYTAVDQTFVLTGTKSAPPRLVDETNGTVTGASLRFRSGDDSVEVSAGDDAGKVRTETRMKH